LDPSESLRAVSDDYEDLASRYEAQDPADYLPKSSHPSAIAGYSAFQKLHVKLLRGKDTNVMWMPLGGGATGGVIMSMHIVSHGTININSESPPGEPIVDYRALSNLIYLDIMVENIKFVRKFMKSGDFAPYEPFEVSPGINVTGEALKEWVRSQVIPTNFHPIATAAKKPLAMGGVVDEGLLIHGMKHLRVVNGSIIPLLPGANTQQTVYMLAEKVRSRYPSRFKHYKNDNQGDKST
jgi:choline dehydrogenase-like flavoprotein